MKIENDLWDFALDFYAQPKVSEVLLVLQDEHGCRINQLLFALWLASINCRIKSLDAASERWAASITSELRVLRRAVKEQMQASSQLESTLRRCYKKLLSAELAAEQVELAHLHSKYLTCSELVCTNINYTQLVVDNLEFCKSESMQTQSVNQSDRYWRELETLALQYLALKVAVSTVK